MKIQSKQIVVFLFSLLLFSCNSEEMSSETIPQVTPPVIIQPNPVTPIVGNIHYLALGDSYTIGQSVCETCRFPEQLKSSLSSVYPGASFSLKVIATTGWTTSSLISALNTQNLTPNYDLVTLLIGVNNQYQSINFSVYQKEFPELVTKAITLAKGDKKNVVVISIPDYAYTPYSTLYDAAGKNKISEEIDAYNKFAENYCIANGVVFASITDITRKGIEIPSLVASDGLHPSKSAYTLFVERMLPKVKIALQD
ncbi:SGNH/GDSL hydrolase family protein [Flavobacterium sp. Fl-77]|uniref:SGNH/GDSL hydrolase family protein n=1 Tax=Flavobacterium flavipigmentatum TaxID=2893884 RepID=A0AAJ2S5D1_9FLAO|nr:MULTISPECIES: SGNH/GDSL hydrolase family protein [unclassified Flavobacterium]MDX6181202.1 SGNH/GDSL hydrolase family protein [Flavobacterium sp. Fl-33]MDX6184803.1 SGNH/GDSL hydrolase family protein [Flavobacterium sp. Fl-77]UFH39900.1 SGNH/GDSL hydrolase family protein [Flavobacterium sp. F-70]